MNDQLTDILKNTNIPYNLTPPEQEDFDNARKCYYCEKGFDLYNLQGKLEKKVVDHCHLSGKYRGAAHECCNINAQQVNFIPVIFHNLSKYDGKFIVKAFNQYDVKIDVIPKTYEEYISFKVKNLKFIDSYRFLSASLAECSKALVDDDRKLLRQVFPDQRKFDLMKRKGEYPYDEVADHNYFNQTSLPPIERFYSILKREDISHKKY